MKAIVNGASGYIGFYLVNSLLKKEHEIYAICRRRPGLLEYLPPSEKLHIIISEQHNAAEKLDGIIPDVWYQLAWEGSLGEMRSIPEIQISDEILSVNAMDIAFKTGCKKIVYTGTVYENIYEAILENPVFDKNSFYIISKKHAHDMTLQFSKKLGMDYVWCTFCHPVGKFMNEKQLIPYALKCFINNQPAEFGSCNQYFDIISVEYLADALSAIGEKNCNKNHYFIGSGKPRILRDYISEAANICGYNLDIGFGKRPDDGMVFKKEWFDCSDFEKEFEENNTCSFKNTIESIAENYSKFGGHENAGTN